MTKDEMIVQLLQQVNSLTATVEAQTALIAQLNQTIQELKEQVHKIPRTVPNHLQVMDIRSLHPRACASLLEKNQVGSADMRDLILPWLLIPMK